MDAIDGGGVGGGGGGDHDDVRKTHEYIEQVLIPPDYIRDPNFIIDLIDHTDVFPKSAQNGAELVESAAGGPAELNFPTSIFQFVDGGKHVDGGQIAGGGGVAVGGDGGGNDGGYHDGSGVGHARQLSVVGSVPTFPAHELQPTVPMHDHHQTALVDNSGYPYVPTAMPVLPHKKRLSLKLKDYQHGGVDAGVDAPAGSYLELGGASKLQHQHPHQHHYVCELCNYGVNTQYEFYTHLKQHYEPPDYGEPVKLQHVFSDVQLNFDDFQTVGDTQADGGELYGSVAVAVPVSVGVGVGDVNSMKVVDKRSANEVVEFSDADDMLDGMHNDVEKVCREIDLIASSAMRNEWFQQDNFEDINFKTCDDESSFQQSLSNYILAPPSSTQAKSVTTPSPPPNVTVPVPVATTASPTHDTSLSFGLETPPVKTHGKKFELYFGAKLQNMTNAGMEHQAQQQEQIHQAQMQYDPALGPCSPTYSLEPHYDDEDGVDNEPQDDEANNVIATESVQKAAPKICVQPDGKKRYICAQCERALNSINAYKYHMLTHSQERQHHCETCGKSFFVLGALKNHLLTHTGDRPYECEYCHQRFRQWCERNYHIASKHSTVKTHICEFCGKSFARKYSLVLHRRIHTSERNFKCTLCDRSFSAGSYLTAHLRLHTGEKPNVCNVCNKAFRISSDLARHKRIHERKAAANNKPEAPTPTGHKEDKTDT